MRHHDIRWHFSHPCQVDTNREHEAHRSHEQNSCERIEPCCGPVLVCHQQILGDDLCALKALTTELNENSEPNKVDLALGSNACPEDNRQQDSTGCDFPLLKANHER